MRRSAWLLALALAAVWPAGLPGGCRAQDGPWADPYPSRAYRQFLTSPYSFRTYSHIGSGYAAEGYTPYGWERLERGPAYRHEEITPYGLRGYRVVPWSRRVVVTPGAVVPYSPPPWPPYGGPPWRP
jgi:hypothetical protein